MRKAASGAALTVLLASPVLLANCGLKTPPTPLSARIPPPQEVRVWTRDKELLVGWKTLPQPLIHRWEGVSAYRIRISRYPLGCGECPPLEERRLSLAPDAKALIQDPDITVYHFTPKTPPATWRAVVGVDFNHATGPDAAPVYVDAIGDIPKEGLQWERITPETLGSEGRPGLRLYWPARRERIVHVVTPAGGQEDRDLMYRANIYRRLPPAPWPQLPVNHEPIATQFWIAPEPYVLSDSPATTVEYQLRLVDQQGNEGPASEPVSIPVMKGAAP